MSEKKGKQAPERIEEVSADLPYELQSKLFDQLATVALGGAGLTITLAGSILQGEELIWIATAEFGLAAIIALSAHTALIDRLFTRRPARARAKLMTMIAIVLIGMGTGSLAMAAFYAERAAS